MVSFYRRYIKNLGTLIAPITEYLKRGVYKWNEDAQASFDLIKTKMTEAPILALPNFKTILGLIITFHEWNKKLNDKYL